MLTRTDYIETRAVKIKDAQAIFSQTIINRLLYAKVKWQKERKSFKTLGKVIDLVKNNKLDDVVSLTKRQRAEIVDYFRLIGVLEYLGLNTQNDNVSTLS